MRRDLEVCFDRWARTHGTFDYPSGRAARLRTGRALARRGLVFVANKGSANAHATFLPTEKGKAIANALVICRGQLNDATSIELELHPGFWHPVAPRRPSPDATTSKEVR